MFSVLTSNLNTGMADTMSLTVRIILIVVTLLVALTLGLLFRRLLVRRLKKTVLDNWIIQTLGIVIVLPTVIIAAFASPLIWDPTLILIDWYKITDQKNFPNLSQLILNLVYTLLLIGLGIGIARTVRTLTTRNFGGSRVDANTRILVARVFYYFILGLTVIWGFSVWGIPIGVPVTAVGILTVAFTVAIQDILKDLVAGFYILIERPFRIGDQISTATFIGKVEDVQLRATKLRLVSGEELTIPNSLVFGSTVINNTYYSERRATISIALPEEKFVKDETLSQVVEVLKGVEHVLVKPEVVAHLSGYAEKKAVVTARFWIGIGQISIVSHAVYALREAFPEADITVKESAGEV